MMTINHPNAARMQYCPACGQRTFEASSPKSFCCSQCGFTLYVNAAAAVAALIESEGDLLLAVRAKDPAVGMLDLPGGFVDHHETIETALARELREELGIDIIAAMLGDRSSTPTDPPTHPPTHSLTPHYVGSYPNTYHYRQITYETVDMFYQIVLPHKPKLSADDDVAGFVWVPKKVIPFDQIAFSSVRDILRQCYPSGPPINTPSNADTR
ncbi:MAG: NUDIX domain-containing protein [Leptolyngbyaceae cyanobacterium]